MKKKIFAVFLTTSLFSCSDYNLSKDLKIERLAGEADHGLNKVIINDTTVILIYRGNESCTMIQLQ